MNYADKYLQGDSGGPLIKWMGKVVNSLSCSLSLSLSTRWCGGGCGRGFQGLPLREAEPCGGVYQGQDGSQVDLPPCWGWEVRGREGRPEISGSHKKYINNRDSKINCFY